MDFEETKEPEQQNNKNCSPYINSPHNPDPIPMKPEATVDPPRLLLGRPHRGSIATVADELSRHIVEVDRDSLYL